MSVRIGPALLAASLAATIAGIPPRRPRGRAVVRRGRGSDRPGLHPSQRSDGAVLHARADGRRRRRCSTTTATAISTSSWWRAARSADRQPAPATSRLFRNDLVRRRRRPAHAAIHRRHRRAPGSGGAPTEWVRRSRITTTTAISTSFSRRSVPTRSIATTATARLPTSPPRRASATRSGARARRSSTTIVTATSISSSPITSTLPLTDNKVCSDALGARDYCGPRAYRPVPDRLYRNDGQGRFTNVTEAGGHRPGRRRRAWRRRSATTTATAGSISTSPTTRPPISCGSTGAMARSPTKASCPARR